MSASAPSKATWWSEGADPTRYGRQEQVSGSALQSALRTRQEAVLSWLDPSRARPALEHEHLERAVRSYVARPGKKLRPVVLMLSAGAVGGDETAALPAAAAVEVFHTWTMVNDDIMDNDGTRRGGPSVHEEFRRAALESPGYSEEEAREYGRDIAILAGDVQHGWAVSLLAECAGNGINPDVVLDLIRILESQVLNDIARGQALDIEYSKRPLGEVTLEETLLMSRLKTGALYEFAAKAGAMIGLDSADASRPEVDALAQFGSCCGTAFQLQDDVLGIIGDEQTLGKPVGTDIREGKRTPIVHFAFHNANAEERTTLGAILGKRDATGPEVAEARDLLTALGGVERTAELARQWLQDALDHLQILPPSEERELLASVARYMVRRRV